MKGEQDPQASYQELCLLLSERHLDLDDIIWWDLMHKIRLFPPTTQDAMLQSAARAAVPVPLKHSISRSRKNQEMELGIDILLYVALGEEFGDLFAHVTTAFGDHFVSKEHPDAAITYYLWDIDSPIVARKYRVAIVPSGAIGTTRAASIIAMLLTNWGRPDVVVLGIAGTVSGDLCPGDVFIPSTVKGYMENSGGMELEGATSFAPSGIEIPCDQRLLDRFRNWPTGDSRDAHASFITEGTVLRDIVVDDVNKLGDVGIELPGSIRCLVGDDRKLASGPVVGKSTAFAEWIRNIDRKVVAIEMEAYGGSVAGQLFYPGPRIIPIRGISDIADERKNEFEKLSGGRFRRTALLNAFHAFCAAVHVGLFRD